MRAQDRGPGCPKAGPGRTHTPGGRPPGAHAVPGLASGGQQSSSSRCPLGLGWAWTDPPSLTPTPGQGHRGTYPVWNCPPFSAKACPPPTDLLDPPGPCWGRPPAAPASAASAGCSHHYFKWPKGRVGPVCGSVLGLLSLHRHLPISGFRHGGPPGLLSTGPGAQAPSRLVSRGTGLSGECGYSGPRGARQQAVQETLGGPDDSPAGSAPVGGRGRTQALEEWAQGYLRRS